MKRWPFLAFAVLLLAGCGSAPAPDLKTAANETEKILTDARKTPSATQQTHAVEPRENTQK